VTDPTLTRVGRLPLRQPRIPLVARASDVAGVADAVATGDGPLGAADVSNTRRLRRRRRCVAGPGRRAVVAGEPSGARAAAADAERRYASKGNLAGIRRTATFAERIPSMSGSLAESSDACAQHETAGGRRRQLLRCQRRG